MRIPTLSFLFLLCILVVTTAAFTQTPASPGLQVTDAKLGAGVQERELVGEAITFPPGGKVFLWLRVTGGKADTVSVVWKDGDNEHTTMLSIGGSPWRTWASKTVSHAGKWTVTVSDGKGTVLKELNFIVE